MTEVSFAKSFLSLVDSKPTKISADHVEDPRSYPARSPYTLPRLSKPMRPAPRSGTSSTSSAGGGHAAAPGSEPSYTVTIKALRNPVIDVRLTSQPPHTSVLDLKNAVHARTGLAVEKMKFLVRKRPVPDSKVLKELATGDERVVEFSVLVIGGGAVEQAPAAAAAPAPAPAPAAEEKTPPAAGPVAQGPSGHEVLETAEFWNDLEGFLQQRLRDEQTAAQLMGVFRGAYDKR